jgi:enoyl-CoA hydratase/carnithine racemase
MATIKQQLLDDWTRDLETSRVETARLMQESFTAPDFREGVRSFLEKRSPAFPPIR